MDRLGKIRFTVPDITQEEIDEVVDTLKSGWITTGPKTKLFEKEIAKYCHTSKAVALNSATACMDMTLRFLGVGPEDEVITSAYTYSASASVIAHNAAKIVLVDTKKDSFHMDYDALADKITEKTKVIIPVDIAGIMCDYDKLFEIVESKKHLFKPANELQAAFGRIIILADAAHAFGATYKGQTCGSVADFTSFSFHAVKNLTTAEGGALTWRTIEGIDDEFIYRQLMLLSLHGQSKDALAKNRVGAWEYDIIGLNYKCNMTDIMSSLGLVQLRRYNEMLKKRHKLISLYNQYLEGHGLILQEHSNSSGHLYLVRIKGINVDTRNKIIDYISEHKIATNVHYKPLPLLTAYKNIGFDIKDYPNAYAMYENEISLPLHTFLTEEDVRIVSHCLLDAIKEYVK